MPHPPADPHVIRFENVTKTYGTTKRPALNKVTCDIEKGEFVFLVGASGSGKSTFLRLILREARPTTGRVFVAGKEIDRLAGWKVPGLRRQIGTVFQDFRLLPNKTVAENVAFALQVIGKPRAQIRQIVPETLELVGLSGKEDRMPEERWPPPAASSRPPAASTTRGRRSSSRRRRSSPTPRLRSRRPASGWHTCATT